MSESKATLQAKAVKLRKLLADAEAVVSGYTLKLAQVEAQLSGQVVPLSGLDELWKIALPIARTRSSQHLCRKEWNLIPKGQRPTVAELITALKIWNRCMEWKRDGNQFVPGLHKFIKNRLWENLPEVPTAAGSRYRNPAPVIPSNDPDDEENKKALADFLKIKPRRMNS